MATMNISLPDQMKTWVEDQTKDGRYANSSDVIRDLIRREQIKAEKLAHMQKLVDEAEASGISHRTLDEIFEDALTRARALGFAEETADGDRRARPSSMTRSSTLDDALSAVACDRQAMERGEMSGFNTAHHAVSLAINELGESDLANALVSRVPNSHAWRSLADFLALAIWSTSDNGTQIMSDVETWLIEAKDERKVSIALHLDVYPFRQAATMRQVLAVVSDKFPSVADRCNELVSLRGDQE